MQSERQGMGRILLMDDDRIVRETLRTLLTNLGYTVMPAKNGDEALALFRHAEEEGTPFSAAILDLIIERGMGGRETAAELRKLNAAMPILVVSGYSNDPIMAAPRDYQFNDSISKPFRSALLISKLELHLQKAGKTAAVAA